MNAPAAHVVTPKLGEYWPGQGGVFVGTMRARDGHPDYHLILATDPSAHFAGVEYGNYGMRIEGAESDWDGLANTKALLAAALVDAGVSAPASKSKATKTSTCRRAWSWRCAGSMPTSFSSASGTAPARSTRAIAATPGFRASTTAHRASTARTAKVVRAPSADSAFHPFNNFRWYLAPTIWQDRAGGITGTFTEAAARMDVQRIRSGSWCE